VDMLPEDVGRQSPVQLQLGFAYHLEKFQWEVDVYRLFRYKIAGGMIRDVLAPLSLFGDLLDILDLSVSFLHMRLVPVRWISRP
jgi:hypothetical protein